MHIGLIFRHNMLALQDTEETIVLRWCVHCEVYIGRSHDALTDAQNTATLLKISQDSAELRKVRERISLVSATPEETLSQPYTLADKFGSGLLDLMSNLDDSDCAPDTDKNDFNSES